MKFANKVVMAVGSFDDILQQFAQIKSMSFLDDCEIHFVHVFNTINYTALAGDFPVMYPVQADVKEIEKSVTSLLEFNAKKIIPDTFKGKMTFQCLFDQSSKRGFCDYVNDHRFDLVIIPTRIKHDLFESSFAQFVNKHCQSNMILLKNKK